MLGLGRILISDLVVTNLLMYSLPVMILLYLAASFFYTEGVLDEIIATSQLFSDLNYVSTCMTFVPLSFAIYTLSSVRNLFPN